MKDKLYSKGFNYGMFIYLQRAFDTVSYKILLSKLEHCSIRECSLEWFRSYLSDTKQYVSVNGKSSSLLTVSFSVPQGSELSPILFLVYINDLPYVSKNRTLYLFADDTNIYYKSKDLSNLIIKIVNRELTLV